jgi:hypothetical protein
MTVGIAAAPAATAPTFIRSRRDSFPTLACLLGVRHFAPLLPLRPISCELSTKADRRPGTKGKNGFSRIRRRPESRRITASLPIAERYRDSRCSAGATIIERMKLPRSILFDLDDTILHRVWASAVAMATHDSRFHRPARADRGDGRRGSDPGGVDRIMGRSEAAQILAAPHAGRAPPHRRDRLCGACGGRPSGAAKGDR